MGRLGLERLMLAMALVGGILLAAGAVFLEDNSIASGAPLILFLVGWSLLSAVALRMFGGQVPEIKTKLVSLVWGGSRFAFLVSVLLLLTCGLASWAFSLEAKAKFFEATLLLVFWMGFTGIIAATLVTLIRVVRRWRWRG